MNVREWCAEVDEEIILAEGFDDAFVGYAERCGMGPVAVYNAEACVMVLMDRDGLSMEEAREHFEFNVLGSYVGERTPMFITRKE